MRGTVSACTTIALSPFATSVWSSAAIRPRSSSTAPRARSTRSSSARSAFSRSSAWSRTRLRSARPARVGRPNRNSAQKLSSISRPPSTRRVVIMPTARTAAAAGKRFAGA